MARHSSLKDFQEALAQRLREAAHTEHSTYLGVEAGGERFLLRLEDTGEVLPPPEVSEVPLTRSWYLGLANVRGNLVSVIDFAAFMGGAPTERSVESRVVLLAERFGAHCGLLVARMLGLKNLREFEPREAPATQPWIGAAYFDKGSGDADAPLWRELELGALCAYEEFLQVGL